MSGHSKWAQIKHKKTATDSKRSKLFSQLSRAITLATREKGNNPGLNASLRTAIEKAQAVNMPKDTIDRAIKKAIIDEGLVHVRYEAYGPGGVAIVIEGITDNNNRTVSEIKKILETHDAKLAPGGAVWAFIKQSDVWVPSTYIPVDVSCQEKIEMLKNDLEEHDDVQGIYTNMTPRDQ